MHRSIRRTLIAVGSAALVVALAPLASAVTRGNEVASSSRVPSPQASVIAARQQQIDLQRGVGPVLASNPRLAALGQLRSQQAAQTVVQSSWSPLGPAPIPNGQINGVPAAVAGRVTAIAVHPTNPNIIYVGTAQGGVWRSLDGGAHWVPLMDAALSLAIGSIAIAPSDPSTVYVGTGEGNQSLDSFDGVGLYRIDNADTTATLVGPIDPVTLFDIAGVGTSLNAFGSMSIDALAVDPTNPAVVFAGTTFGLTGASGDVPKGGTIPPLPQAGLFRTTNGTAAAGSVTFTHLVVRPEDASSSFTVGTMVTSLELEPGNHNNLLVGTSDFNNNPDNGIWRSTTAQAAAPTFTRTLSTGLAGDQIALAINKVGTTVTVVEEDGGYASTGTVRKSTDGGATWSAPLSLSPFTGICGGQCWYDVAIALDPADANVILVGGTSNLGYPNVIKSVNGGSSWTQVNTGLHSDTHVLAYSASAHLTVFTGNDGGIWSSVDGGSTWTNRNSGGLSATQFESMSSHPTDPNVALGGTQDNGTNRRDGTGAWLQVEGGDGGFTAIDTNSTTPASTTMYHTFSGRNARVSTNGGTTWGTAFGDAAGDGGLFYPPVALGPGSPANTLYLGSTKLRRSTNKGSTDGIVSQDFGTVDAISAVGIAHLSDNVRLVGLTNGHVFLTTSGATTLTDVTGGWVRNYVARAVVDPRSSTTAYITLDGFNGGTGPSQSHVWKTTNLSTSGTTWTSAGSGIPDVPVNAFVVDPANSSNLFAGTDIGVYYSTDGGATWSPLGTGLPRVAVFDMSIAQPNTTNEVLRVGTHGRGAWQTILATATGVTITTPTTLTGAATATFSSPVTNVNLNNFVLRTDRTGTNVLVTQTCKNAGAVVVNCGTGAVTTATLSLASGQLVPGEHYTAYVNPVSATSSIRNVTGGQTVRSEAASFRAATAVDDRTPPVTDLWPTVIDAAATGGSYTTDHLATANGSFAFSGTAVTWITLTGPNQGIANVKIDGVDHGPVDLFSASTVHGVAKPFSGLAAGNHIITINVTGTKNASSTGTFVAMDAFMVGATTFATPTVTYSWQVVTDASAFGGSFTNSDLSGSSASLTFRGTGVTWRMKAGPDRGMETVVVDGVTMGSPHDDYQTTAAFITNVVSGLSDSVHTVSILPTGTKNAASSGTNVGLDEFIIS